MKIFSLAVLGANLFSGTDKGVWKRPLTEVIGIQSVSTEIHSEFSLSQNYPNPFNPVTNIKFQMPNSGPVKITVFDIAGREVAELVNQNLSAGTYNVDFDASHLSSGAYFYRLQTKDFTSVKKMILIK